MAAPLQTATPLGGGPMGPRPPTPVSPAPSKNEADAIGRVSADSLARDILKSHKAGLNSRRERDLISEKLLLHVDGSGDFQWADIFDGIRVEIPRAVSEFRKTENILRLLVDNAVAHHTTMALRFMAESMPDRRAKNQAIVDTIWANHLSHTQDFNGLFAEALYLAMPAGFCFDSETEVLTESGFKFFRDVDIEKDLIASLDPDTGKMTYAEAVAKQEFSYDGLMFHWSSSFIDLMVTPEHRMLVYQRQREVARAGGSVGDWTPPYHNGDPEKQTGELRFVSAFDAAQQGEIWVRKDAVWEGEEPETFVLPAPTRSKYGPRSDRVPAEIGIEDYLRFMGWYLSEGSFSHGKHYQVQMTQKDDAVRQGLADLLARVTGNRPRHKNIQAVVDSKRLAEYVRQFGHSHEKFVPPNIKAMSPRLIRIFLDALFSGDGSIRKGRWACYYTSSRQLSDDVQELLLKVGLSCSVRKRDGGTDCGEINGVRIKNRRDSYEVSVNHEKLRPQIKGEPGLVAYKGKVWDLTVPPNGTLFVRRRGKVVWSGNCPVHAYWREDTSYDWYETAGYGQGGGTPAPGMIDCFVGNPFGTVFDVSARKNSVRWMSYERILPADLVREQFGHMPGVSGLEGTTKIPSTAEFQIIAKQWMMATSGVHGSPVLHARRDSAEELMTVICREIAPGVNGDPGGRLQIIAVPGNADSRRGEGGGGHAVILADQELPGRDFSWTNIYSHHRGSDIHGKPWVEDLDPLQVDLNIARSKRWETVLKMAEAPIVAPGGAISEDMADLGGYNLLEVEPSLANWRPRVMEWSQGLLPALDKEVEELRRALYTGGGYQASSRGEAPGSRMAYRAIVALQQADNTIHGPVNVRFQRSACDFTGRCHSQFRMYGDVPWLVNIVGDEFAHLAKRHIDKTQVSDRRPQFRLVNSFGPSPELRAQEILELMSLRGADGEPFMTTEEGRRQYPNALVFDTTGNPTAVKRRRAMTIAEEIHNLADQYRQQTGMADELGRRHPWTMEAGDQVFQQIEQMFPRLRDDLLEAHIAALSEITQDETADPIACVAAEMRLELYFQWQAMMAGIPTAGGGGQPGGTGAPARDGMDPASVATEMQGGGGGGGTTLDDAEGGSRPAVASTAR